MTENETPTKKQHRWVSVEKWFVRFCSLWSYWNDKISSQTFLRGNKGINEKLWGLTRIDPKVRELWLQTCLLLFPCLWWVVRCVYAGHQGKGVSLSHKLPRCMCETASPPRLDCSPYYCRDSLQMLGEHCAHFDRQVIISISNHSEILNLLKSLLEIKTHPQVE